MGGTGSLPASVKSLRILSSHWLTSSQWHPIRPG